MDFAGRRVLVTGASRGIGAAVARAFADRGAQVALHCNSGRDDADLVAASLAGTGHTVVQGDIADADAVARFVSEAAEALGGIDILVNNAGIYRRHPIGDASYGEWQAAWRETIDVNLIGAANVTWCVAQLMVAAGGGRIVNVSSRGAFRGEPDHPAYGAAKAGMNAMGQSLAQALAPHGIGVMTVAPGFVETDMARDLLAGPDGDAIRAQSPRGRVATADEVAYVVCFLASDQAAHTTGAIVDINGASYLRT